MVRRAVRYLDERSGAAPFLKGVLRYVFPDHWSFLLGEIALYSFIVLVATGVYLTLFFEPSLSKTVYHGSYSPLRGVEMTDAYRSVLDISFRVKAGLLIRQTHHWAANVFVASIVVHLLRIFFTGAFRKPRDLTYLVGLAMLMLARPHVRRHRRAVPDGRADPDQPGLAVGSVRGRPRHERRTARLVPGLADRRAPAGPQLRRDGRQLHAGSEPVLGRRGLPAAHIPRARHLAVGRAPAHRRSRLPP